MTDILDHTIVPSGQTVESRVGDETVLLHLDSGLYYGLDPVGTRIWEGLRQGLAPAAICAAIASEYAVARKTVEDDARRFLADLERHAIVEVR